MQIREISLQELDIAYALIKELHNALSYEAYEDLIYEMRHKAYKMFGLFHQDTLLTYAGLSIQTNLSHQRHLHIDDLITKKEHQFQGHAKEMLNYIQDYAKINMCSKVILSVNFQEETAQHLFQNQGYEKQSYVFVKELMK